MLLCVRPYIIPQESLSSYIYRLATANLYSSVAFFSHFLSITVARISNNEFDERAVEKIAQLTNNNREHIEKMTIQFFGCHFQGKIPRKSFYLKNRVKYCPACVQTVNHHQVKWAFAPVTACLEHHCLLIEKCQCCNQFISMVSLMRGRCEKCHFQYKQASPIYIKQDSMLYRSQVEIQEVLFSQIINNPLLSSLSLHDYLYLMYQSFYLLEGLNSFVNDAVITAFSNKKGGYQNNENLATAFCNAVWMYHDFPLNFYTVLYSFNKKNLKVKYEQKKQFEKLLENDTYKIIKDAYDKYWLAELAQGTISKTFSVFKRNPALLKQCDFLHKEDVKKVSAMAYKYIEHLEGEQRLQVRNIKRGNTKRIMVERSSLENIVSLQKKFMTKARAANVIGIQKDSIGKLVDSGFLSLRKSPTGKMMFHVDEVESFLNRYRGEYVDEKVNGIYFYGILTEYSVNNFSITKILEYVDKGYLRPFTNKRNGTLADSFYHIDDVLQCLQLLRKEKQEKQGYYMKDVMEKLNVGEKAMRKLVNYEVFIPKHIVTLKDGRKHYFFDKEKIDDFAEEHLTVAQVTEEYGVPKHIVWQWVKEGRLTDISKGACKGFLLNKKEVAALVSKETK
jgi:hypothetical protein